IILVISENSFRSEWVRNEFSLFALSNEKLRILPVKIDQSEPPSYLADFVYLDLSTDFEQRLEQLSALLKEEKLDDSKLHADLQIVSADDHGGHIPKLRSALRGGFLTLVCGAGISVQAGVPVWNELLLTLLHIMMEKLSRSHSLKLDREAVAEFYKRYASSSL